MTINPELPDSFWQHVRKTDSCWEWTGSKNKPVNGYGWFRHKGKQQLSHRLVCADIPPGMCVLHHCDNPACVNPDHLFFGTKGDNARDAVSKNRDSTFRKSKIPLEDVAAIRRAPRDSATTRELAERYGVTPSAINQLQNYHTWKRLDTGTPPPHTPYRPKGEEHFNARITEADVRVIREAHATRTRRTARALSEQFGITTLAVYAIWNGACWAHVKVEGWEPVVRYGGTRQPKPRIPSALKPTTHKPAPRKLTAAQKRAQKRAQKQRRRREAHKSLLTSEHDSPHSPPPA